MIHIIIPFYNEEKNVARVLGSIKRELGPIKHKIHAVDDGSKDRTLAILKKNDVEVISHTTNLGVAEAFRSGFEAVNKESKRGDAILIMEGDGTSEVKLIREIVKKIEKGADIVIASRYADGGGYRMFPLMRLVLSRLANLILRYRFPYPGVRDYTIFYRGYSQIIIKKGLGRYKKDLIQSKYFTANSEILTKFFEFKPRIEEVPFVYDYSLKKGSSGLVIKKNLWQYFRLIFGAL